MNADEAPHVTRDGVSKRSGFDARPRLKGSRSFSRCVQLKYGILVLASVRETRMHTGW